MEYFDVVGVRDIDEGRSCGRRGVVIGGGLLQDVVPNQVREIWMPDLVANAVEAVRVVWG